MWVLVSMVPMEKMFAQRDSPVLVDVQVAVLVLVAAVTVPASSQSSSSPDVSGRIQRILPAPVPFTSKSVPLLPPRETSSPMSPESIGPGPPPAPLLQVILRMPTLPLAALVQPEVLIAPPVKCSTETRSINQGSLSPESIVPIVYSVGV